MTEAESRAAEIGAMLYRRLETGEEIYVYQQLFNFALRRSRYPDDCWLEQW